MTGAAVGQRVLNFVKKALAFDVKNNLYCEVDFDVNDQGMFSMFSKNQGDSDVILGNIYRLKSGLVEKLCK